MPIVTRIEATTTDPINDYEQEKSKRKVCAYARVSTEQEEQEGSYDAQVCYYTNYIQQNPEWEFVGIYSDKGLSGTGMKKREGFQRMIKDAMDGKIDFILTKSISRFARNTADALITIRQLRSKGVAVYFEKENIRTDDSKGEILLTIMSSLAQEESRSISENVTWGQRKRMADGVVRIPYKNFLGYRQGENGLPEIDEEEAAIIREIYTMYLKGYSTNRIAKILTERKILTPRGKTKWSVSTVKSILTNEKYKGDALLQKSFTVDFLTKKTKKNTGELPQYYVHNSHPAIIEPEVFDRVQEEMKSRAQGIKTSSGVFAGKIVCGDCGNLYGRRTWHSKEKCKYSTWQCAKKYAGEQICDTPDVREVEIQEAFVKAINQLIVNKKSILKEFRIILSEIISEETLMEKFKSAKDNEQELARKLSTHIEDNKHRLQNQNEHRSIFEELKMEYDTAKATVTTIQKELSAMKHRKEQISKFLKSLEKQNLITEFSEETWLTFVENVTVNRAKSFIIHFKNGSEITIEQSGI